MLWLSFLQLKAYAKFQGIPKTYNTDDSGFSLEKDKVTATPTGSLLNVDFYCYILGHILIFFGLPAFEYEIEKELPKIKEYKSLVTLIAVFNVIICLSEILELKISVTYLNRSPPELSLKIFWMFLILRYCLSPSILKILNLKILNFTQVSDASIIIGFLSLILSSLLPAFFLLLVYPIKVVSLFAYTVAFTFFVMYLAFSNTLHPFHDTTGKIILVYHSIFTFVMLFFLTMTKAAVFAPGAYGMIPLLPPVFITSGIWILKKKVISENEANGNTELEKKTK